VDFVGGALAANNRLLRKGIDAVYGIEVQCRTEGTGSVLVQLQFAGMYESIRFGFGYQCVFPHLDMVYESAAADPARAAFRVMADDSVVQPLWKNNSVRIPSSEGVSAFSLVLDDATTPAALPTQWYTLTFLANQHIMSAPILKDPQEGLAPRHALPNAKAQVQAEFSSPVASVRAMVKPPSAGAGADAGVSQLELTWRCNPELTEDSLVRVALTISYGWVGSDAEGVHFPSALLLHFEKACAAGTAEGGGGGGGWSGAGIFFFTLFIFGLVVCIGGSAWNYVREGKRGLWVLPGYVTFLSCVDRVRGSGASSSSGSSDAAHPFSPQMDDSATGGKTGGYGAFGAGDSYQSNL